MEDRPMRLYTLDVTIETTGRDQAEAWGKVQDFLDEVAKDYGHLRFEGVSEPEDISLTPGKEW